MKHHPTINTPKGSTATTNSFSNERYWCKFYPVLLAGLTRTFDYIHCSLSGYEWSYGICAVFMLPPNGQLWRWSSYGLYCFLCSYACYSTAMFLYVNLHSQVQAAMAHDECSRCIVHVGNFKHAPYTMFGRQISPNSSTGVRKSNAAIPPMSLAFDLLGGNLTPPRCTIYDS
jgi:hypothetical protein